jgi:hypothetical protein
MSRSVVGPVLRSGAEIGGGADTTVAGGSTEVGGGAVTTSGGADGSVGKKNPATKGGDTRVSCKGGGTGASTGNPLRVCISVS